MLLRSQPNWEWAGNAEHLCARNRRRHRRWASSKNAKLRWREVKPSPKAVSGVAAVVDSLVQRGASLSELKNVIQELEQLHNFLDAEGQRLEQEISEYVQLKKSTVSSTRLIADNLLHWKKS